MSQRRPVGAITVVEPDRSDLGRQLEDSYCGALVVVDGYRRLQAICALYGYHSTSFGPQQPLHRETGTGLLRIGDSYSDAWEPTGSLLRGSRSRDLGAHHPYEDALAALAFRSLGDVNLPVITVAAGSFRSFEEIERLRTSMNQARDGDG